jgi:ribosomal protein L31E
MAEENKVLFEREYVVPLRREWLRVPSYMRATRAVKALKKFIAKHMKVYDRDLRKIKVDIYLNNEIRFRGMKHPPAKIKVKASKTADGVVRVYLANVPKVVEYKIAREARLKSEGLKKAEETEKKQTAETAIEKNEDTATKEREETSKLAEEKIEKKQAKEKSHLSKTSGEVPKIQRKSLKK